MQPLNASCIGYSWNYVSPFLYTSLPMAFLLWFYSLWKVGEFAVHQKSGCIILSCSYWSHSAHFCKKVILFLSGWLSQMKREMQFIWILSSISASLKLSYRNQSFGYCPRSTMDCSTFYTRWIFYLLDQ